MSSAKKLSELEAGSDAEIRGFAPGYSEAERLREMGLLPGTKIRVIRWAPLGDPLEIKVRGYNLSIRKCDADFVEVNISTP